MKVTVSSTSVKDKEKKPIVYKCTLEGTSPDGFVEATVTLKSTDKRLLEKYTPLEVGSQKDMAFKDLNKTLDEYARMEDEILSR